MSECKCEFNGVLRGGTMQPRSGNEGRFLMVNDARSLNGRKSRLTPPQSLDSEKALLGSLLIEPEKGLAAVHDAGLEVADFYDQSHAQLFRAVQAVQGMGLPITPISVHEHLETIGCSDGYGSVDQLIGLMESVPHGGHAAYHANLVKEKSDRRWMATKGADLQLLAHSPESTAQDLVDFADGITARFYKRETQAFPSMTAEQLDQSRTSLDYLVEWLLVKGQPCIFAGGKKCLKTNILIDLSLSLSLGIRFLGVFVVPKAVRVALMSGESGQATIQETARRIALSKGYPLRNFRDLLFCFSLPTLGDPKQMVALKQYIVSNRIEVLIIDPAYLAMPVGDSAGNLFDMGKLLKSLSDIGQETGCTIILCHHTRKAKLDPFAPVELEDIAWSGFQEFARQWLLIGRRELYNAENGGEHKMWLNCGGSAGHSHLCALDIAEGTRQDVGGRRWEVQVLNPSEARSDAYGRVQKERDEAKAAKRAATVAKACEKLRKALKRYPEGETVRTLRDVAGLNGTDINAAIETMRDAGELADSEITKGKRKLHALKLTGTSGTTGTKPLVQKTCLDGVSGDGTTSPLGGCPSPTPDITTNGPTQPGQRDKLTGTRQMPGYTETIL